MIPHHSTSGKDVFSKKKKLVEKRYNISSVWLSLAAWAACSQLCTATFKWKTSQLLLWHFLLSTPFIAFSTPFHYHPHPFCFNSMMGNCFRKPVKCAHASSTNFHGQSCLFFFFNTVYILYELIAMFLDWVVDVFFGSFCICLDDGAVLINRKLGNLKVLGRFFG